MCVLARFLGGLGHSEVAELVVLCRDLGRHDLGPFLEVEQAPEREGFTPTVDDFEFPRVAFIGAQDVNLFGGFLHLQLFGLFVQLGPDPNLIFIFN